MAVRIIEDRDSGMAAMYDSVTGFAFGPTCESKEELEALMDSVPADPRSVSNAELERRLQALRTKREQEEAQA